MSETSTPVPAAPDAVALLRIEHDIRLDRIPWKCDESGCPCRGQQMSRSCGCYVDAKVAHDQRIDKFLEGE